ncbi:MAG: hypothetical protein EOO82_02335 [Oxalobacteraceae bacterium]|nr:MAG: hypothetical protein EOO82_02335 [Oxalobacteraceae bacterium]
MERKTDDYFFAEANVQRLVSCTATWQPLHIYYPREVNVTRFIAWLLDPSEGHGLGDLALQSLLTASWWNIDEDEIAINTKRFLFPLNVNTEGFSSVAVTTEIDLATGYLDILAIEPNRRRYIAIENKLGAQQSKTQLKLLLVGTV